MEAIKCIFENGYFKKESLKEVLKKGYKEMYEDSLRISEEWQSAEDEALKYL
ncbi:MAG: hypothetical protein ACE5J3_06170 [Methanosarcinales archaeon]